MQNKGDSLVKSMPAKKRRKLSQGEEWGRDVSVLNVLETGRQCSEISEDKRQKVCENFYGLADLEKEWEYMAQHIETTATKAVNPKGWRQKTHKYFLTNNGKRLQVCKNTFLTTLGNEEKFAHVVLEKITDKGIVKQDKRGAGSRCRLWQGMKKNGENLSLTAYW